MVGLMIKNSGGSSLSFWRVRVSTMAIPEQVQHQGVLPQNETDLEFRVKILECS